MFFSVSSTISITPAPAAAYTVSSFLYQKADILPKGLKEGTTV